MIKEKCINFEESMNELCMTVNHNTDVALSFLQLTYTASDNTSSEDFMHIKPSKQLGKLFSEELKDKDYQEIINNFIINYKESILAYNQNMEIFRTWIHDNDPTSEGHEYSDIIFDMVEITEEKTSDELETIIDVLTEKVKENTITMNVNIEMLIERITST